MTTAVQLAQSVAPGVSLGFKNRIINGGMVIDQRNAGASVTPTNGTYTLDRWGANMYANTGKFTVQQNAGSVTPPTGFTKYLGVTSSSSYSVGSGDVYTVYQGIEGNNCADLAWGTSNAKTVTLSFQVYSSLTGTFGGALTNGSRSYPFSYTVSSATTWTSIAVTIPGDTSGTWPTDNTSCITVRFGLGSGSTYTGTANTWQVGNLAQPTGTVSVVGTSGATFYITGVQLEVGTTATSFEFRDYGRELIMCQRYYHKLQGGSGGNTYQGIGIASCNAATTANIQIKLPVTMRTLPTPSYSGTINVYNGATSASLTSINQAYSGPDTLFLSLAMSGATFGTGTAANVYTNNDTGSYMQFSAEL